MRQFILRTDVNCKALYAYLKQNWQAMANANKPLSVSVAVHKDKRHGQQKGVKNAYF